MVNISPQQKEILDYLTVDFLTPKQIGFKRNTTVWAVYKTIKKLKDKGLLIKGYKKGGTIIGGYKKQFFSKKTKLLRLHNIQVSVKILDKSKSFLKLLDKTNKIEISNSTIMIYKDYIEVYTKTGLSFTGYSTDECYSKAIDYFSLLYSKIENRLKITINKREHLNKKWVRQHIAECNSEVAEDCNKRKDRIAFKAEDGKTWLTTDNSFNLEELEFIHPVTAKPDTDRVKPYFDDFRLNNPASNSALALRMQDLATIVESLSRSVEKIINNR